MTYTKKNIVYKCTVTGMDFANLGGAGGHRRFGQLNPKGGTVVLPFAGGLVGLAVVGDTDGLAVVGDTDGLGVTLSLRLSPVSENDMGVGRLAGGLSWTKDQC